MADDQTNPLNQPQDNFGVPPQQDAPADQGVPSDPQGALDVEHTAPVEAADTAAPVVGDPAAVPPAPADVAGEVAPPADEPGVVLPAEPGVPEVTPPAEDTPDVGAPGETPNQV